MHFPAYFSITFCTVFILIDPILHNWKNFPNNITCAVYIIISYLIFLTLQQMWKRLKIDNQLDNMLSRCLSALIFLFLIETTIYYANGRIHFWDTVSAASLGEDYGSAFASMIIALVFLFHVFSKPKKRMNR